MKIDPQNLWPFRWPDTGEDNAVGHLLNQKQGYKKMKKKTKTKPITRWVSTDLGGSIEIWRTKPYLDQYGEFRTGDKNKPSTWVQTIILSEFQLFYPNIEPPKPGECFEITFE